MNLRIAMAVFVCLPLAACGDTPPSPPTTATVTAQAGQQDSSAASVPAFLIAATPAGTASTPCPAIGFDDGGAAGATVTSYGRCGFTVTATTTNWTVWTGYGNPAPFIGFMSPGGVTNSAEVRVTSSAGRFTFQSVDVYSSTTPIPYVITGVANSATVFAVSGTQPNTFGKFATVSNPNANLQVDALVIRLTNPAAACCANPVGLDNIAVK
jgi:hypothetical protein